MNVTHPQRIIDAHCHIGEIPPWKFYDLEHPVKPTVYDYRSPAEFVKNHMDEFKIERALAMSNYGVPIHEISFDLNDVVMEAATTNDRILAGDLGLVPAAQRRDDAQGAQARRRVARRGAEDDLPARRQPRSRDRGTRRPRRWPTSASTPARSTTWSSTSTRARAATRTSRTSSRSSRPTASAARSTSCTSAAGCRATSASCPSSCSGCRTATRSTRTPPGPSASARAGC